jgi:cytochrome b involved in lipid metabolism
MAPNTDQVRQRRHAPAATRLTNNESLDDDADKLKNVQRLVTDLKDLKSNEIILHGVIYDVETLKDHPGGELPKMLGGNDATNYYQMIHPYHTKKNFEKHLLRVGTYVRRDDDFPEYVFC